MQTNPIAYAAHLSNDVHFIVLKQDDTGPTSVLRLSDNVIFRIGDWFSSAPNVRAKITGFVYGEDTIFVSHTWSGIGFSLGMLERLSELPSRFQEEDWVTIPFKSFFIPKAQVKAVHFFGTKSKYDLEVSLYGTTTRIYNVDALICEPYQMGIDPK